MNNIYFHCEELEFTLKDEQKLKDWITRTVTDQNKTISFLNFIFCSDPYLLQINREHLDHNYLTDIITFHYGETNNIEGDIYISIDRVEENAQLNNVVFTDELHRVIIHGVLHLLGFKDKTDTQKQQMRKLEDHYLALRSNN